MKYLSAFWRHLRASEPQDIFLPVIIFFFFFFSPSGAEQQFLPEPLTLRVPEQPRRGPKLLGRPFLRPVPVPRDTQTQQKATSQLPVSPLLQQRTLHQRLSSGEPCVLSVSIKHSSTENSLTWNSCGGCPGDPHVKHSWKRKKKRQKCCFMSLRLGVPSLGNIVTRVSLPWHLWHYTQSFSLCLPWLISGIIFYSEMDSTAYICLTYAPRRWFLMSCRRRIRSLSFDLTRDGRFLNYARPSEKYVCSFICSCGSPLIIFRGKCLMFASDEGNDGPDGVA